VLVVTGAGTKKVAKLVMFATEAIRRIMILEAPHTSDTALDGLCCMDQPFYPGKK